MVTDEQLLQGLRRCKELGALAQVGRGLAACGFRHTPPSCVKADFRPHCLGFCVASR